MKKHNRRFDPSKEIKRKFTGAYQFYCFVEKKHIVIVNQAGKSSEFLSIEGVWGKGDSEKRAWLDAYDRLVRTGKMEEK